MIQTSATGYSSGYGTIQFITSTTDYPLAQIRAIDMGVSPNVFRGDLVFYSQYNKTLNEAMRIQNGGNVGIGTVSPYNTFSVYNTTADNTRAPDGDYRSGQLLIHSGKSGSSIYAMAIGMDQTYGIGYLNAAGNSAVQPICLQTRGGNVGIGTTSPSTTLHVNGSLRASSLYTVTDTNGTFSATNTRSIAATAPACYLFSLTTSDVTIGGGGFAKAIIYICIESTGGITQNVLITNGVQINSYSAGSLSYNVGYGSGSSTQVYLGGSITVTLTRFV
jgi:hypothetical protein